MKKKKKITKATLKKRERRAKRKADRILWNSCREQVKIIQDNKCFLCSKEVIGMKAHVHHIISREFKILKYDIKNLILLCPYCHKFGPFSVHKTSIWFSETLRLKDPERYEYLLSRIREYYNGQQNNQNPELPMPSMQDVIQHEDGIYQSNGT